MFGMMLNKMPDLFTMGSKERPFKRNEASGIVILYAVTGRAGVTMHVHWLGRSSIANVLHERLRHIVRKL